MEKFNILLLDTKARNPNHYICIALRYALASLPNVAKVVHAEAFDAIKRAEEEQCNLFVAFDGEELDYPLCHKLAELCGASVLWVTEDPYEISKNQANAGIFDLVFTNDSGSVTFYGEKGRHLPLAGCDRLHYLPFIEDIGKLRYDVFFGGTAWPNRVELIADFLREDQAQQHKLKLALPSNEHLPAVNLPLPRSAINWRMSVLDFSRFANLSLATLVLPRVFSASGNKDFAETPPPRLFEAALAGTVQLVQSNLAQAKDYFVPGKEFLYFDDAKHLSSLLAQLKNNPVLRQEIALSAQARAHEAHLYKHRAAYLLGELEKCLAQKARQSLHAVTESARPAILMVTHNLLGMGHFGGVEVYLASLQDALKEKYDIYYYSPGEDAACSARLSKPNGEILEEFSFGRIWSPMLLACDERENAFGQILIKYGISLVHFHHLINHVPAMIEVARFRGAKVAFTFHDYYAVCKKFTLIDFRGNYCHPEKIPAAHCDICLGASSGIRPGGQASRRAFFDRVLNSVDFPIFNTEGARGVCASIFPSLAKNPNAKIIPVPSKKKDGKSERAKFKAGDTLNVAVLGNFTRYKGADVIARAMAYLRFANIVFYVFGRVDRDFELISDPKAFPNVRVVGEYSPGELPVQLDLCHVSLHVSIWPETYCLTLSEAWDAGLVPVVTDIGALGERVLDGVNGYKIQPQSEGELIRLLLQICDLPEMLDIDLMEAVELPISRLAPHLKALDDVYGLARPSGGAAPRSGTPLQSNIYYLNRPWNKLVWGESEHQPVMPVAIQSVLSPGIRPSYFVIAARYYQAHGLLRTLRRSIHFLKARMR